VRVGDDRDGEQDRGLEHKDYAITPCQQPDCEQECDGSDSGQLRTNRRSTIKIRTML